MNRQETLQMLTILKSAYPNFYKGMGRSEAEQVVALWESMFTDDPVEIVSIALKRYIATDEKGFPPHIGAIKAAIAKIKQPERMTEIEAWNIIRNSLRVNPWDAQEKFDALPPLLKRLVGSPGQLMEWAAMDVDTLQSVVASNFQRSFRARMEQEREILTLPGEVKEAVARLAEGIRMPGAEKLLEGVYE